MTTDFKSANRARDLDWYQEEGRYMEAFCVKSYAPAADGGPARFGWVVPGTPEVSLRDLGTDRVTGVEAFTSMGALFDVWMVD